MKRPKAGDTQRVRDLAASGWNETGIARELGVSETLLRAWLKEYPDLKAAHDEGREVERQTLHNALYKKATDPAHKDGTIAAMFLLKTRHGYKEGVQDDASTRVALVFNVPAALPVEQYVGTNARVIDGPSKESR